VAAVVETTRVSDATGILGTNDFLVLAPGTDEKGAETIARRLLEVLHDGDDLGVARSGMEFSAGYYAAQDGTGGSMAVEDLLGRPMEALRQAQSEDAGLRAVLRFHPA
jgi:GGDEF domain-containing protein